MRSVSSPPSLLLSVNVKTVTDIPGDIIHQVNKVRILFPRVTSLSGRVIIITPRLQPSQPSGTTGTATPPGPPGPLLELLMMDLTIRFSIITSISLSSVINRNQPQTSGAFQYLRICAAQTERKTHNLHYYKTKG